MIEKETYNKICQYLKEVIKDTEYAGKVYTVGGCCRDIIMGNPIKDIDLVVELPNGGINFAMWLFCEDLLVREPVVYPTYSTAMFSLKDFPDIELEAVQTRKESYNDPTNRNPVTAYGSITEDCYRRDFCTNTIYYNVTTEEFLDITKHGIEDIHNGVLRTPTDPVVTFSDDPLRMLRCIRFAVRYNWTIEQNTYDAIAKNASRLSIITKERVLAEFIKIMSSKYSYNGISMIWENGLTEYIFNRHLDMGASDWMGIINVLKQIETEDYMTRLAVLFIYINGNTIQTQTDMTSMKFPNSTISYVCYIIKMFMFSGKIYEIPLIPSAAREFLYECKNIDVFNAVKSIMLVYSKFKAQQAKDITLWMKCDEIFGRQSMFGYKMPVDGNDIISTANIKPGPEIKDIMNQLMYNVYENPNITREELLFIIKEKYSNVE